MFFYLTNELVFPDPHLAEDSGLLAMGGDLSPERLVLAYSNGIFPWYNAQEGDPILWYATAPRFVLFPENIHISKSMKKFMKRTDWYLTENKAFEEVMRHCGQIKRPGQQGTWISEEMIAAYVSLHHMGYARSIEVWDKEHQLIGGLYGVELNNCFFGESMFSKKSNSSKLALIHLTQHKDYKLIDCQMETEHIRRMGGEYISFDNFLKLIQSH